MSDAPSLTPMPAPPEPRPPRNRTGRVALAIALAVAIVAGAAVVLSAGSDRAKAQPLALAFVQGENRTYRIHQTMDARLSSAVFGEQPLSLDVTQVVGWEVVSVDADGVATIEVTVSRVEGRVNGTEIPSHQVPPLELVIAPDGRIVSAGGYALGGAGQTAGFGFPGMGQLTPILPDDGDEVTVGDTWEKAFTQEFPFGEGTISFAATSTYERNETVDGREVAVIATQLSVPVEFTLSVAEVLAEFGDHLGAHAANGARAIDALDDARLGYDGRGEIAQTSFVDLEASELVRTQSDGTFDMTMRVSGISDIPVGSFEMAFAGAFTQEIQLLSPEG